MVAGMYVQDCGPVKVSVVIALAGINIEGSGAFQQSTVLFDPQLLTLEISYENEDDFVRNLACFQAELRFALAVHLPAGVPRGTFPPPDCGASRQ
jgi:hypothetical protein